MRPIRSGNENDWARENEKREFKDKLRHQREEMILNPPTLVTKTSWIMAGLIMGAVTLGIIAFIVLLVIAAAG